MIARSSSRARARRLARPIAFPESQSFEPVPDLLRFHREPCENRAKGHVTRLRDERFELLADEGACGRYPPGLPAGVEIPEFAGALESVAQTAGEFEQDLTVSRNEVQPLQVRILRTLQHPQDEACQQRSSHTGGDVAECLFSGRRRGDRLPCRSRRAGHDGREPGRRCRPRLEGLLVSVETHPDDQSAFNRTVPRSAQSGSQYIRQVGYDTRWEHDW